MITSSYSPANLKNLYSVFDNRAINKCARQSIFLKREYRKISPLNFLIGFFLMTLSGSNSYSAWAAQISLRCKGLVSKQALCDRMSSKAVHFVQLLLEHRFKVFFEKMERGIFSSFNRVLIQDSTTLSLPGSLVNYFPGNKAKGEQRAVARIQCVFDLLSNQFCLFGLFPYVSNDQSASSLITQCIRPGDLIIRDLGFFVLNVFHKIQQANAYFLSRLSHNVCIYFNQDEKVNLLKSLNRNGWFDHWVTAGNDNPVYARVIGIKVPDHIANERIRKARTHKDKRFTYSEAYLKLLHYNLYITNVSSKIWSAKDVHKAYRNRWKIEIIFKAWKSNFSIQKLIHHQCYNINRIVCTIYLMLLFITIFMAKIYNEWLFTIKKKNQRHVSLIKLSKLFTDTFEQLMCLPSKLLHQFILKFACYEKRKDRQNLLQLQENACP